MFQLYNATHLLVTTDQRLWVKIGQDSKWRPTDIVTYDNAKFDINSLYSDKTADTYVPSAPDDAPGPHGHHSHDDKAGSNTSLVIVMSVLGTVIAGAVIAILVVFVMKQRRGSREYRSLDPPPGERSSLLDAAAEATA